MRRTSVSFRQGLAQFLTPQIWKQVHRAWRPTQIAQRWTDNATLVLGLTMTWCCGDSEGERFASARAFYVRARTSLTLHTPRGSMAHAWAQKHAHGCHAWHPENVRCCKTMHAQL